jgi:hypothetical protein
MTEQLSLDLLPGPSIPVKRNSAMLQVEVIVRSVLPTGAPLHFRKIIGARYIAPRRIVAEQEMFDGLPGEMEAWQWRPDAWAQKWNRLDGGDISLENGAWLRVERQPS